MKKIILLFMIVFACLGVMAGKWDDAESYYDNSEFNCSLSLPENVKASNFVWQLTTPLWRVMMRGQITREAGKNSVTVPLKFDELKPGTSLKCILQLKSDNKVIAQKKIIIYSKKIFKSIAGALKIHGAGAVLPAEQIEVLNSLGMKLPERPLDNFEDPANKLIFCDAKKYCDNVDMLSILMGQGKTLVMIAPPDNSEIYLPSEKFIKFILISSKKAKTTGALGVICNKEKIKIQCSNGPGGLVEVKYQKGRIIIIAHSVFEKLDKIPEAALILKKSLYK